VTKKSTVKSLNPFIWKIQHIFLKLTQMYCEKISAL
jgi:hypothetical protein